MLIDEIKANFHLFDGAWIAELNDARDESTKVIQIFEQSYLRIACVQAWRTSIVMGRFGSGAEAFFFEAQNDFLTSHCLARCGSVRQALKSLRSAIENIYFAMYYKDHPIELELWESGKHKLGFQALTTYFESHPKWLDADANYGGTSILSSEYSTLSKAVHGSAKSFRMTKNLDAINLWTKDGAEISKWSSREKLVVQGLNLFLIHLFRNELQGASLLPIKETIALTMSRASKVAVKRIGVNIA